MTPAWCSSRWTSAARWCWRASPRARAWRCGFRPGTRSGRSSRPPRPAATPTACGRAEAPSAVRQLALAHHGEHVVVGDRLAVLVGDGGIPAHLAIAGAGAQRLLLAGEAHADAIAGLDGPGEAQRVDAVVGEHRTDGRVDEQARGGRDQEVAVGDAPAEERIARRLRLVHVRVEMVAGECREALDVRDRHLALPRVEGVTDGERRERLAERVHARVALARAAHPAPGDR